MRRNPPEVRVTGCQTTLYQGYLHCNEKFCATFLNIFSKEINSDCNKMSKINFEVHTKLLEVKWNETDDEISPVFAQFLWILKFISSSSQRQLITALGFRKCEKHFIYIPLSILVQDFCPLKTEIGRFPAD